MDEKYKLLTSELGDLRIKQDEKVGEGVAKYFFIATTTRELVKAVILSKELQIPYWVIGSGSKIAVASYDGLIIKNRSDSIRLFGIKGKVSREGLGVEEASLEVDSGVSIQKLLDYIKSQKLVGLEFLGEVQGTIGGNYYLYPLFKETVYQVKVLNEDNEVMLKDPDKVLKEDIIVTIALKLKSHKN